MTKRERVIRAIEGKEVDGIPSGFSLHFPEEEFYGQAAVEAHLRFFQETDTDIIKIMNENLLPSFGLINSPQEYYDKLPVFSKDDKFIQDQIDLSKEIMARADKDAFSMGTLHGICASAIHPLEGMGEGYDYDKVRQMLVDFLRKDEEKMLEKMDNIADVMAELAQAYIKEVGLDSVYYASLGGETKWFTDEEFEKWIKPFDLRIMKAIKDAGGYCFLHICKEGLNMERYDEDYLELADVINWGVYETDFSLEEGRKQFPGKTLMGGLQNRTGALAEGDKSRVQADVKKVIEEFGRKNFILGADCTLATEQDLSLVKAAAEQARQL